jgi:glucose/arabinose dehydrogenase
MQQFREHILGHFLTPVNLTPARSIPSANLIGASVPATADRFRLNRSSNRPAAQRLVFIDAGIEASQSLVSGVLRGSRVVILDKRRDGIQQISETLANYRNLSSLHIVSNGRVGTLELGNTLLNTRNLAQYRGALQNWRQSLNQRAEIFLYGCNVAQGGQGAAFVRRLGQMTGRAIAASTDLTGNAALGGDWNMEFKTGQIRSGLVFSTQSMLAYQGILDLGVGLRGEYFDNIDFTTSRLTRTDATVNFNWGSGSPNTAIAPDTFSVRWTGRVQPRFSETYTFFTNSDDGTRLWVNNQLVINNWIDQAATERSGTITLEAGRLYDIRLEYYERGGAASSRLSWASRSQTKEIIPQSRLYLPIAPTAALAPVTVATVGATTQRFSVTYSDDTGILASSLDGNDIVVTGPNGFRQAASLVSVSPTGNGTPRTATYSITAPGSTWDSADNGTYTIALQANQVRDLNTTPAAASTLGTFQISIAAPPSGNGTGLRAEYFDNIDLTASVAVRTDATVHFTWGTGAPLSSMGVDTFSARWTGEILPRFSEVYTFQTTSDDGVRLWVNNQLLIDRWIDQSATAWTGTIALEAGRRYSLRMEYYENGGDAVAALRWASPSQPLEVVPQSQLFPTEPGTIALRDSATIFVGEAAGFATVTAVRTGNTQERVTVEYTTNELGGTGSATANVDFTQPTLNGRANTGQFVFEVGETTKTFTIPITNDSLVEGNESFAIGLQNPSSGSLGAPRTVLITIVDNDSANTLSFSEPAVTVSEGIATATITVQRSGDVSGTASVNFATSNGTAIAGSDYTATTGTVTFEPNQVTRTIAVPITNDALGEGNETFNVTLSTPVGAALGSQNTSTVTILDNDLALGTLLRRTAVSGLTQPTAIDWTPDGRYMLVAQQNGVVRLVENNTLRSTPLIDLSAEVNGTRDRGLLGLAVHPQFSNGSPFIYLLYTYDPPETATRTGLGGPNGNGNRPSRLVRVRVNPTTMVAEPEAPTVLAGTNSTWAFTSRPESNSTGDIAIPPSGIVNGTTITAPASLIEVGPQDNDPDRAGIQNQNIRDYLATDSESHTIGAVHFGLDGYLYLSNGDGTSYNFMDPRTVRVQDPSNLSGKVLRIDPITGAGVTGNPFFNSSDPNSNRSKVFYSGLRNPFRFTFDPVTRLPVIGDVGWNSWEEINTGTPGSNFGWPYLEGPNRTGSYQNLSQAIAFYNNGNRNSPTDASAVFPILSRSHGAPDNANAIMVGDFYNSNTLMFGDINGGTLYAATLNDARQVTGVQVFDSGVSFVVDMEMGPDGRLYGVNLVSGTILRWDPA